MDDMTAFERQVADEILRIVGPSRPVDDLRIVTTAIRIAGRPPARSFPALRNAARLLVASAVVAALVGFVAIVLPQLSDRVPSVGGPGSSPPPSTLAPMVIERGGLRPDVLVTSDRFRPRVAFVTRAIDGLHGEDTDWCPGTSTSERVLILRWLYSCRPQVRLIRPFSVDCGTIDEHPDALELAAAIVATPGSVEIRDEGDLSVVTAMAPGFDLSGHTGRVLRVTGTPSLRALPSEPVPCRFVPEPGSADPIVEAREVNTLLVLMDIDGELVVLQAPGADDGNGTPYTLAAFHSFRFID
jgi:hypothetical protein